MEYVIVAFRSRSESVKFSSFLSSNGIDNELINTPKEVGIGCGLSVKVNANKTVAVKRAVYLLNLKSYSGVYSVNVTGKIKRVKPV